MTKNGRESILWNLMGRGKRDMISEEGDSQARDHEGFVTSINMIGLIGFMLVLFSFDHMTGHDIYQGAPVHLV
jgi:hypothetical protein